MCDPKLKHFAWEKEQNRVHLIFTFMPLCVNFPLWRCIRKRWGGKFSTSPKAKTLLADRANADEATRQRRLFCPVLTSTCADLQYALNDPYLCIMRVIILCFKWNRKHPLFCWSECGSGLYNALRPERQLCQLLTVEHTPLQLFQLQFYTSSSSNYCFVWQWLIDCYQGQDETAISLARVNVQIVITAYKEATNKCNLFEPFGFLSLLLRLQNDDWWHLFENWLFWSLPHL